ncbi:GFA family protein [Pseudoroseomonas wenyumeiae]
MPLTLEGSCRCGAVRFTLRSHTPVPYQRCYCSICRKTAGGGGYAINIMGDADSLQVHGQTATYRAELQADDGTCETSSGRRHFCPTCASALWMADPSWPDLVHPFASAIDTPLPVAEEKVHLMLRYKAPWVEPQIGPRDATFEEYPEESIEDWHRKRGLWVD